MLFITYICDRRPHEFVNVSFEISNYFVVFDSGNSSCNQIINAVRFLFNVKLFLLEICSTFEVWNYFYDIETFLFSNRRNSNWDTTIESINYHDYELIRFWLNWIWKLAMMIRALNSKQFQMRNEWNECESIVNSHYSLEMHRPYNSKVTLIRGNE